MNPAPIKCERERQEQQQQSAQHHGPGRQQDPRQPVTLHVAGVHRAAQHPNRDSGTHQQNQKMPQVPAALIRQIRRGKEQHQKRADARHPVIASLQQELHNRSCPHRRNRRPDSLTELRYDARV